MLFIIDLGLCTTYPDNGICQVSIYKTHTLSTNTN